MHRYTTGLLVKHTLIILFIAAFLPACKSDVNHYNSAKSSPLMVASTQPDKKRVPFIYTAKANRIQNYNAVMLDPVEVYTGKDNQFGWTSHEDRATLATYMHDEFQRQLKEKFSVVDRPGPQVMRLHLILAGADENWPLIAPLSKATPGGFVMNSTATTWDADPYFSGSVRYIVEISDSTTDELLYACITKQHPWAIDIVNSFGMLDAPKAGIRDGAQALTKQLTAATQPATSQPADKSSGASR